MKKGDIWKFKDPQDRGWTTNRYLYCKGVLDDETIMVDCIITQAGEILISNEIVDLENYKNDLIKTSVEEFLSKKYNFEEHCIVDFIYKKRTEEGVVREIDNDKKKVMIEIEDDERAEYKEVWVKFEDILIVYPEHSFNDLCNFKILK